MLRLIILFINPMRCTHYIEEVFVKSFPIFSRLLILGFIAMFALAACVRPTPRPDDVTPETPATEVTTEPVIVPTTVPPVTVEVTEEAAEPPAEEPVEDNAAPEGEATAVPEDDNQTAEDGKHIVQAGDTLFRLSLIYGVSVEEIAAANGLSDVDTLEVGQELTIPLPGEVTVEATATPEPSTEEQVHIVQPGDNLFRIGLRYGFTVSELADYNGIANPNQIEVGQEIRIPPSQ